MNPMRKPHRPAWDFVAAIYVFVMVLVFWQHPVLLTLLLCCGIIFLFRISYEKADLTAMIFAAFLGTLSETACVNLKIWTYHAPGKVFGIPIWLPLVWASLFCIFRRISIHIYSFISGRKNNVLVNRIFWGLRFLILIYFIITVCTISKIIAVIYTAIMIPAMIFWHRKKDILVFMVGAFFGTIGEFVCMKLGYWHYHYPVLRSIGMPISLPLAWGLSAIIVSKIARLWESN